MDIGERIRWIADEIDRLAPDKAPFFVGAECPTPNVYRGLFQDGVVIGREACLRHALDTLANVRLKVMAQEKTAYEWDADPRNGIRIKSWSDFGANLHRATGIEDGRTYRMTWEEFKRYREGATISRKRGFTLETEDGITPRELP